MYDFLDKIGLKAVLEAIKGKMSEYASKELYGDTTINVGRKAGSVVGDHSTAEGINTTASGYYSHAEGTNTTASGVASHAEGGYIEATGNYSHAEGYQTCARGYVSHAEGMGSTADGSYSHAGGFFAKTTNDKEFACGTFNQSNEDTLFSVGDGTDDNNRRNAFEITKTGGKLHDKDIAVKDDIINPNLLINPDFRINQRGISGTFSDTGKYFVDRWRLVSGTVTVNSDGTLTLSGDICQPLENAVGTNVTASVSAGTAVYDNTTQTFTITGNGDVISWAKLEIGSAATTFIPPDPATELMKCRRYYRTMSRGTLAFAVDAASVVFVDPFEMPMRVNPTTTILSPVALTYCNGWLDQPDVTEMSIISVNLTKMGACYIHVGGFNVAIGETAFDANYLFRAATDNFIGFDAEIY